MTASTSRRRSSRSSRRLCTLALLAASATAPVSAALISPLEAFRAAAPGLLQRRAPSPFDAGRQPLNVARVMNSTTTRRPRASSKPRANSTSTRTAASDVEGSSSNSTASTEGRYGHSAIYSPKTNLLYFVGGQLGENGTTVTNEVLVFNLASSVLWGPRPMSAIPDNPLPVSAFSTGLDPLAWAASTIDSHDRAWVIGGVTEDCEHDHTVHRLDLSNLTLTAAHLDGNWSIPKLNPHAPPRRRQAQAVNVHNTTTKATDIYVFGGIAEEYTCSDETIGYLGVDRYSTADDKHGQNLVESFGWTAPSGTNAKKFEPPVSDYTATLLSDGRHVALVGGQNAHGGLTNLSQTAKGKVPTPRMGHVAIGLASGAIVIHGGVGSDHIPVGDLHLLTPPAIVNSSSAWTWSTLATSDSSMASPLRAWHTATKLASGTVVVAFGIDTSSGSPSYDISFLKIDEKNGLYTFTDQFAGENATMSLKSDAAVKHSTMSVHSSRSTSKTKTTAKAKTSSMKFASTPEQTSTFNMASPSVSYADNPVETATPSAEGETPVEPASVTPAVMGTPIAASTKNNNSSDSNSSQTRSIVAASVTSLVGLAAIAGLATLYIRRRNSKKGKDNLLPGTPLDMTRGGGKDSAPIVSSLLYTRPVQARHLSLGSTMSAVAGSEDEDDYGSDGDDFASSTGAVLGAAHDPFSDRHVVNELGQTHVIGNLGPGGFVEAASASSAETQRRTNSLLDALSPSLSGSVKSIPYLAGLKRTDSGSSYSDTYTVRTPSRRSRRGPTGNAGAPSLPPGAGPPGLSTKTGAAPLMQEYGLALSKEQTPQAAFMEFRPRAASGSNEGDMFGTPVGFAGVGAGAGHGGNIPAILRPNTPGKSSRPSTPLRVTNAD